MPTYVYQAANEKGRLIRGSLFAATREGALTHIRELGYLPVKVDEASAEVNGNSSTSVRGIKTRDVAAFTRELADLLGAGLELDRALGVISGAGEDGLPSGKTKRSQLRELIITVRAEVQGGEPLAKAMGKFPRVFTPAYTGLVGAGEAGGNLDVVLERLVDLLNSENEIRGFILKNMTYPLIVAGTSLMAVVVMLTFVIPRFSRIFAYLGQKLPWPTQALVSLSHFVTAYGLWIGGLLVTAGLLGRAFVSTERGRAWLDRFKLEGPGFGGPYRRLAVARLSRTLGALLSNGLTLADAMQVVVSGEPNRVLKGRLARARDDVVGGLSLSRAFGKLGLFPDRAIQVLRVGEETGELDRMLSRVGQTFETETKREIEGLLGLLEPVLILVMAVVVAFVILAMLLPVLSMNNFAL